MSLGCVHLPAQGPYHLLPSVPWITKPNDAQLLPAPPSQHPETSPSSLSMLSNCMLSVKEDQTAMVAWLRSNLSTILVVAHQSQEVGYSQCVPIDRRFVYFWETDVFVLSAIVFLPRNRLKWHFIKWDQFCVVFQNIFVPDRV